jgi:hypothetical protein
MAIASGLSTTAKLAFLRGEFSASDVYKVALYDASAHITPMNEGYTPSGEVVGQGYQKGGLTLEGYQCDLDGMSACLTWSKSPQWKNATINARGAMIYNASKGNRAVVILDFGKDIISTNGNWTFPMPALSATTAIVRFA